MALPVPKTPEDNAQIAIRIVRRVQMDKPLATRSTDEIGVLVSDVRQLLDIMLDAPSPDRDRAWLLMETGYAYALDAGDASPGAAETALIERGAEELVALLESAAS